MKKLLLLSLVLVLTLPGGWAQTGFQAKKKVAAPGVVPSFDFQEVPRPTTTPRREALFATKFATSSLRTLTTLRVLRDEAGRVVWLEDRRPTSTRVSPNGRQSAASAAFQFLGKLKGILNLENPETDFELIEATPDEIGQTHLRMRQMYQGVPVYGGELMLHTQSDTLRLLNGRSFPTPALTSVRPALDVPTATERAMAHLGKRSILRPEVGTLLARLTEGAQELVIYHPAERVDDPRLTWHLTLYPNAIERWEYFVDARTGEVLHAYNHTCGLDGPVTARSRDLNGLDRTFSAYQSGIATYLIDASRAMFNKKTSKMPDDPIGALWTIDAGNTAGEKLKVKQVAANNTAWNATAVSAHYNAGVAFDYYAKTFQRNSLDGKGGTVISVINMADADDGLGLDNAFWNGKIMAYGNGRKAFKPLAGGLDVAGHEMTHGVIQNTANLEYQGQSGAINESMADVFGVLIDRDDWTLGEDIVKPQYFPSGAMRSMSDPNQLGSKQNGYQPKTMAQYIETDEDNGGVHINSGIPNYAFYLIASKIGKDKSERIYYRALSQYLTRRSKFLDLRLAIVQSTSDLFGATSIETNTAKQAFDAVGIVEGQTQQAPPPQDLPVNNGQDALLVADADDATLYLTTPQFKEFIPVSRKGMKHKASVTDDGQVAYYVSDDKRIRASTLTGTPRESIVANDAIWGNVAIARDGRKLAALMATADASIWVYSFDRKEWKKFPLYNPTYTEGIKTGEVQYADSFEWDAAGENLVYDAYNEIKTFGSGTLNYWDVGFINVWKKGSNTFGSGKIEKLFNSLEEGENIGNPAFSKTSPSIVAFDYYNDTDDSYYLLGADIEKGDLKAIYENTTLGFPDYSRTDRQMVFNTKSGGQENVGIISLNADRISPRGSAQAFIQGGKWTTWFAQGNRPAPPPTTKQAQTISLNVSDLTLGDGPVTLNASASSGLLVSVERLSGGISVQGKTITVTQAGKASIRVSQPGDDRYLPAASVERTFCVNPARPTIKQNGLTLTASALGADKYIWYNNGVAATSVSSASVNVISGGQYSVRAVTNDGCQSALSAVAQVVILATASQTATELSFYPNPVRDGLTIEGDLQKFSGKVSISDINGNTVELHARKFSAEHWEVDTKKLLPGLYILSIEKDGAKVTRKILKE